MSFRTVAVRVGALALLLLLALVATLSVRTLNRVPTTLLYFVRSNDEAFTLERAPRRLPRAEREAYLVSTLQALIAGPDAAEAAGGLASFLPPTTEVLNLRLRGREVRVDFSSAFAVGGGSATLLGRLFQVFYTLTQPSYVDSVRLFVEGEPVSVFGSEGILVGNPWRRVANTPLPVW